VQVIVNPKSTKVDGVVVETTKLEAVALINPTIKEPAASDEAELHLIVWVNPKGVMFISLRLLLVPDLVTV